MHAERATRRDAVDRVHTVRDQPTGRPAPQLPTFGPVRAARHLGGSVPCAHMPRAPRVTSADLPRALHRAGWTTSRQSGSHVILVHPERAGARVVVPVHAGRILKPKTLAAILKSAQIASDELPGLL
jgi:predicted RNA binding protein YcfA (HicA-like mRNA interferase family)